jgi:hypothetical protein
MVLGRMGTLWRAGKWSVTALLAATAIVLFVERQWTFAESGVPGSLVEQSQPGALKSPSPQPSEIMGSHTQEGNSGTDLSAAAQAGGASAAPAWVLRQLSFAERFAAAFDSYEQEDEGTVSSAPGSDEPVPEAERSTKESARVAEAPHGSVVIPESGSRTAVYDIAAHAVYLPNGERLEAHSGLGSSLDDPRRVTLKKRGPTPPNVYGLVLREGLFHGVRAIRLVPVDENKMFGRGGMLAHSYMLGHKGQSNGCVVFRDYPEFLRAFLKGEVKRLVVVDHRLAALTGKSAQAAEASHQ